MHTYTIKDTWGALKVSFINFIISLPVFWLLSFFVLSFFGSSVAAKSTDLANAQNYMTAGVLLVALIQSIVVYIANSEYIIDMETGSITFPRSDIENSILAILFLHPYWNLMRTKTIHASEVENVYLNTKRSSSKRKTPNGTTAAGKPKFRTETINHVSYTVNITGTFGSSNLAFSDKQKRDEVRNAIQQCVKKHTGKTVDRKVAEFS